MENLDVISLSIYSNDRKTILAEKSLKICSTLFKEQEVKNKLLLFDLLKEKDDILHKEKVRSGDRISSNGNLYIIGDVNQEAIVSAKKNIYAWGQIIKNCFRREEWK